MALEVNDSPLTRFAQDAERRRIARELHDGVVQSLTALVTDLEYFRTRRLSAGGETNQEVAQKLETWQELARDSLLSMRETLGGLRHHTGPDSGIESSVYTLLAQLSAAGYTVTYECDDWPDSLPHEYASNLYAIIRESLTNICKHAHASKISVFMFSHEGQLHVSVADNGVGIPEPAAMYTKDGYHQGLIGLRERAAALEGLCSIESAPGRGTRVDVVIPLP
ncbi:MAG TPA: sensor histidine kinase [Ktedonobacteraceae bacterium]|nr:sensor histidine kinase [Ktedonobacteraceae bacterium]